MNKRNLMDIKNRLVGNNFTVNFCLFILQPDLYDHLTALLVSSLGTSVAMSPCSQISEIIIPCCHNQTDGWSNENKTQVVLNRSLTFKPVSSAHSHTAWLILLNDFITLDAKLTVQQFTTNWHWNQKSKKKSQHACSPIKPLVEIMHSRNMLKQCWPWSTCNRVQTHFQLEILKNFRGTI